MNIQLAVERYLDELGTKRALKTQQTYKYGVAVLQKHLMDKGMRADSDVKDLTMDHLIAFPAYLSKQGYSKKTTGLYMASVRSFANWLIVEGHISPTPRDTLRFQQAYLDANRRRESRLPRWPEKDDVAKMLIAVRSLTEPSPRLERDIAVVEFLASTGCRNAEICGLNIDEINMKERSAMVVGKGNKERVVYFSTTAANALENYWKARKHAATNDPVFCRHDRGAGSKVKRINMATIRTIIKDVMMVAGIEKFTPHYFRHAFAIKMLRETGNLALVQDLLGHSDPAATRVYAKIYPDELRDAHHKIFN